MTLSTTTTTSEEEKDVAHKVPIDSHLKHIWIWEPPTLKGVLTLDGMTQIAIHKYVAGSYTSLDTMLNPIWQQLTDLLPMWLAPNTVTTLGGCCCFFSYFASWWYNPLLDQVADTAVPSWILILNGVALCCYYTLDCMDGKQARRTSSSSPLGQLFDHGMDCICNMSHISLVQCMLNCPSQELVWIQCSLQFTFYLAQWEEYYTGILPHSTGDIGVTEVNYGLGLCSILLGLVGTVFGWTDIFAMPLPQTIQSILYKYPMTQLMSYFAKPNDENSLVLRHVMVIGWLSLTCLLSILSLKRVGTHLKWSLYRVGSAYSKLLSPALVCACAIQLVFFSTTTAASSWLSMRRLSIGVGTCMSLCTIKMIVYSMAHMAYATVQLDILPIILVGLVTRVAPMMSPWWLAAMIDLMATYYLVRLIYWSYEACTQLCERLDIAMFRIRHKKEE